MPSSLTDFMLLHVFTALLPPVDPEERDYYQVLGLQSSRSSTAADIRKAYKVKSLELHPDKVAQRGGNGRDDAEAEYQLVQEAYGVLNDAQKRNQYHSMGCSVARYRFVYDQQVLAHPTAVYDNLSKASFMNKTRLILLASLICAVLLLQPILVAAKVNQNLKYDGILQNVSWTIILIPLWIVQGFMLIFWLFMLVMSSSEDNDDETPKTRLLLLYTLLEHTSWLAGEILLALQWDNGLALQLLESRALGTTTIDLQRANLWHLVSIPFYLGLFFRIMVGWTTTRLLAKEQDKMMTPERFEQVMVEETATTQQQQQDNPELQEDDPAVLEALAEKYTVVTVPEFSAAAVIAAASEGEEELSEEEQEVLKVHMSPEFQAVQQVISSHYIQMLKTVILGFSFVALVACKLQGQLDDSISWWVVFVPIWIYFGQALSGACWICCCTAPPTQDMEVLLSQVGGNDAAEIQEALAQAMAENGDSKPASAAADAAAAAASSSDPAASKMEEAHQQTSIKVDFASAEGNIEEFNDEASPSCQEVPAASTPTTVDSTEEQDKKESAVEENDAENGHDSKPAAQQETEEAKEEEDESGGAAAWNFEAPPISEEYMKQQARAQSSCCMALFGIMMVCLIVGKLEQDYPTIAEIQKSSGIEYTGFNAFWILFPILLATCLLLCCCSCLIYGAGESSSLNDLVDRVRSDDDDEEGGGDAAASRPAVIPMQQQPPATEANGKPEPVLISTASSSTTTAAMDYSSSAASSPASSNKVVVEEEEEVDMNDLD